MKSIPITDRERHSLYGFMLKWFGGYPVDNLDEQCDVILKLVEKEFLKYSGHTPEKELCSNDLQLQKQFKELAPHLNAEMKGVKVITPGEQLTTTHQFPESRYVLKVPFDFEDLPQWIVQRGIIWRFEDQTFRKDEEYYEWQNKLANFLNSVPQEYRKKAVIKGIEYGEKVYKFHLHNECTNPSNCNLNQSWERRLVLARELLENFQLKGIQNKDMNNATKLVSHVGFIIHGHDQTRKYEVARFIDKDLKRNTIILHEQPNKGRTIIEKFEDHSNVEFAISLWTADDIGNVKDSSSFNKRARQNVIFETGFFIGKIGRKNVIVLYEEGVEIPSDYSGVIFIPFNGNWKDDLRKEIEEIYSNRNE